MSPEQEMDLKDVTDPWVLAHLPPIKNPRRVAYFKAECSKVIYHYTCNLTLVVMRIVHVFTIHTA